MNRAESRVDLDVAKPQEVAELQAVFEASADYFRRLTGRATPDPDAAQREMDAAEATEGREVALVRLRDDGRAVGALGWWAGSPEPDVTLLGMLLIEEPSRGQGLAREALGLFESLLREGGMSRIRTAVGADDRVSHAVLAALGFAPMDERRHVDMDGGRLRVALYEKEL